MKRRQRLVVPAVVDVGDAHVAERVPMPGWSPIARRIFSDLLIAGIGLVRTTLTIVNLRDLAQARRDARAGR